MKTWEDLIDEERKRQDEKRGVQDASPEWWMLYIIKEVGELSKAIIHEPNPTAKGKVQMLQELVQVGALAKAMYESGIRNGWLEKEA